MDYKQEAIKRFNNDLYATETTGIVIEEVCLDYAKCSLKIEDRHLNAAGVVMGGAIFTLADFTFAVASNCGHDLTVTLSSQINYINGTKGPNLYAKAKCKKSSERVCFYDIEVSDDNENLVASISTTGYRKP